MTKLQILKKMLMNLTPKQNFHPHEPNTSYPHCVIGEAELFGIFHLAELGFTKKETLDCIYSLESKLTHKKALAMIQRVIKRASK